MKNMTGSLMLACSFAVAVCSFTNAQEWSRFRGPNGTGESEAKTIPTKWTEADYNWKTKLPGIGHSSPTVWGDKIFLLSANPQDATRFVLCVSAADGKILWNRQYSTATHHLHARSSYASSTPAADADQVYFAWSDPSSTYLKAFTHDGTEVWSIDLGPWVSQHGFGTSPMLYEDMVVITGSQENSKIAGAPEPSDSYVVAVDRKTGQVRWKTPRGIDTASYTVPSVYQPAGGEPELVCHSTAEGIFSLDPKTGKQNWAIDVFTMRTISLPIIVGDLIFGTTGSGGGGNYVVAVRPGKAASVAYEIKTNAPYVPSPVAKGDLLFLWFDAGIVSCIDAATGKVHWRERVGGNYSGSPVRVGDYLYCISEDGEVVVLSADKEFQEISRNPLGEQSRSTPAVSGGRMYLRSYSHLISIGGKSS